MLENMKIKIIYTIIFQIRKNIQNNTNLQNNISNSYILLSYLKNSKITSKKSTKPVSNIKIISKLKIKQSERPIYL